MAQQEFHNYADYALTEPFAQGLAELLELSGGRRCAIMCSEAVWWRCHRRIVADYLILNGREVVHLMGPHSAAIATITPGAIPDGDGLTYPPAERGHAAGEAK